MSRSSKSQLRQAASLVLTILLASMSVLAGEGKKIVFIAGAPSHGPGEHEHRAGCLLLKSCLDQVKGVTSIVYSMAGRTTLRARLPMPLP
jgi:hypothetical protein